MATLVPSFGQAELFYDMSSKSHKRLDESFTLANVWRCLRIEVLPKLFGKRYDIIMNTENSGLYRPFSVYCEDKAASQGGGMCASMCKKPPKKFLANFKDMMVKNEKNADIILRATTVQEDHRFPVVPCCHFHLRGVRTKSGKNARKEIVLQFCGLRKYYTCLPLLHKGDTQLEQKYAGKKLFIVHELFAVDQMWITTFGDVSKDKDKNKWEFRGPMPIAVRFREFSADFFGKKKSSKSKSKSSAESHNG